MTIHAFHPATASVTSGQNGFESVRAEAIDHYGALSPMVCLASGPIALIYALHRAYDAIDGEQPTVAKVLLGKRIFDIRKMFNVGIGQKG